jgi:NTP pyrophosphatase (non-canonical NTP hydrolase)
MSDEQGGIQQKASEIADLSAAKSGEIVEAAQQIVDGDVREGLAKILKAAGAIATGATEKGIEIAADAVDKVKKPTETESAETE